MNELWEFVQNVLKAVAGGAVFFAAWLAYKGNVRAKQIESSAAPYGALADRVGEQETQIEDILKKNRDLTTRVWEVERSNADLTEKLDRVLSENGEYKNEIEALHSLTSALFLFIDAHVAEEVTRPFIRPSWIHRPSFYTPQTPKHEE